MKWWQTKVDHGNGFLGVFHTIVNILTEALRILFNFLHINYSVKGHDLAYWVSHIAFILLGIYLLYVILDGQQVMDVIK